MSYGEVPEDKSVMYSRVISNCGYVILLGLFNLGTSCSVFVLTCFVMCVCVCVYVCVCVCVCGVVCACMCGCVGVLVICLLVFTVFCTVCTVFFILFRLCIFILIRFVCISVRTSITE